MTLTLYKLGHKPFVVAVQFVIAKAKIKEAFRKLWFVTYSYHSLFSHFFNGCLYFVLYANV